MKRPSPKFPKRARGRAKKIKGPEDFRIAEDRLRAAIKAGNSRTEKFWREVFGAYADILHKRGDSKFADLWNVALRYAADGCPPRAGTETTLQDRTERAGVTRMGRSTFLRVLKMCDQV